jgi:NAD(P)-dependent dehydrogenase (short-subunit alcohol dehydrogenase family)
MNRSPLRVIVTAAGGGIGRRIAERFADQGARVHASDVDGEAIEAAFAGSNAVTGARVDVTDEAAVNTWMDAALADMSGIDVLVNCAGTAGPTSSLEDMDFDEWQRCLNVNLNGQFLCSKRAIPPMRCSAAD